ncbi:MAG: type II toxin-antitoxin system VapC family toxin [Salinispira sp.]
MKNKVHNLSSYTFSPGERILVDANVWLYCHPAPSDSSYRFAQQYTTAFQKLVTANAQPIIDPVIVSEYVNRYTRTEWKGRYSKQYRKYKDFRKSSDFPPIAQVAQKLAKKILSFCQIHSIPANKLDINQALTDFSSGNVDFNDALFVDICKKDGLKLMTNDGDFTNGGIEVLTTHPKLLRACS